MRWVVLIRRVARGAALAMLGVVASGCSSAPDYPPNLAFPSRTDRLVLKSPQSPPSPPSGLGEPGERESELARLDSLGGETVDPGSVSYEKRAALDQQLKDLFGTPAVSRIALESDAEVAAAAERLGLTAGRLTEGGKLFRRHCLQCHNITGDGRGPAGNVMPYPRDFRRGQFKFTSTGGKPRRADILRTLAEGLKGTAMPSFALLADAERELLAGYVSFLSLRGQVEFESLAELHAGRVSEASSFAQSRVKPGLTEWEHAQGAPPIPASPDDGEPGSETHMAAVKRGFELFTRKADNACHTCHADFGRKPVLRFDVWGTIAKPADLTANSIKGGTRPEDVFARVRGGIPAVGMPAHPELSDRQVWDLVRFVKSMPYMRELSPEVRAAVYPGQ